MTSNRRGDDVTKRCDHLDEEEGDAISMKRTTFLRIIDFCFDFVDVTKLVVISKNPLLDSATSDILLGKKVF